MVNVQGDEPFIEPEAIDQAIAPMLEETPPSARVPVCTLKTALPNAEQAADPNAVKVVTDREGRALYFSRARLPFVRNGQQAGPVTYYKHLGLYVYEREFLVRLPGAAARPAGGAGEAGTVAGAGKRLQHPRRGNHPRFPGCGYRGGLGSSASASRRCNQT